MQLASPSFFNAAMQRAGGFETHPTIAIAVSGGADSIALMHFAKFWTDQRGGKCIALTVNHGMRAEAQQEAAFVHTLATSLGMQHHTLNIHLATSSSGLQQQARTKRYEAMEAFCTQHGILHLLTAHHADDNMETLAMHAWRSHSISELQGIPFIRYRPNLRLIRPLLNAQKSDLTQWLTTHYIPWKEDTSNHSDNYERNRLRKALRQFPIPPMQARQFLAHMACANLLVQNDYIARVLQSIRYFPAGYAQLDWSTWQTVPTEYVIRLLLDICHSIGNAKNSPRHHELLNLANRLSDPTIKSTCLCGLQFARGRKQSWYITRELAHVAPAITLFAHSLDEWDGRMMVQCADIPSAHFSLNVLGEQGLTQLKESKKIGHWRELGLPRAAIATLPAIWHLDQLRYVPHIAIEIGAGLAAEITVKQRLRQPLFGSLHRYHINTTTTS